MLLGVVHNNETIIPAHEVVSKLGTTPHTFQVFEVSEQVLDSSVNFHSLIRHAFAEHRIERLWRGYRNSESVARDITSAIGKILRISKAIFSKSYRSSAKRIRQIEKALTKKHLEVWEEFRSGPFDFLLVLEADATWTDSQRASLTKAIKSLCKATPSYLSISGGLDMEELGTEKLITQRDIIDDQEVLSFHKPVTNTSCAYIINRPLVDLLLDAASEPSNVVWKLLPIDWYINSLFIHLNGQVERIRCTHFNPPLLIHGSMSGTFSSWHPERN